MKQPQIGKLYYVHPVKRVGLVRMEADHCTLTDKDQQNTRVCFQVLFHFICVCVCVLSEGMSMHHVISWYSLRSEGGIRSFGNEITGGCEPPRGC